MVDLPPPEAEDRTCACCRKTQERDEDLTVCAICRRRTCVLCLRPYGHHMRVCEDCRLSEW
jgi:hypothetical protein